MLRAFPVAIIITASLFAADNKTEKTKKAKGPEPTADFELGYVDYRKSPGVFNLEVPKGTKRVEIQFIICGPEGEKGPKTFSLDPAFSGVLSINDQEAIRFVKKQDGAYLIRDFNKREFLSTSDDAKEKWLDVSNLIKHGNNRVSYSHYQKYLMGVRVRFFKR